MPVIACMFNWCYVLFNFLRSCDIQHKKLVDGIPVFDEQTVVEHLREFATVIFLQEKCVVQVDYLQTAIYADSIFLMSRVQKTVENGTLLETASFSKQVGFDSSLPHAVVIT
jgi:hypothetical protein